MTPETEEKLKQFATQQARAVFEIDYDVLEQLVISGAKWMEENETSQTKEV